ncbi:hypothetical protein [Bradyrhizobium sp. URHC0002]
MRAVMAFGLLITLCATANAAPAHRSKPREGHLRPIQRVTGPTPQVAVPGWTEEQTRQWLYNGSAAARFD